MIGVEAGRLLGDQAIEGRRLKTITFCDNAFVTNNMLAQAAHWTPQEALLCAKAKRQQQMFYLCESEATATNVFCSESKAAATKRQPERKSTHTL
ncbi:hypothetical protein [Lysinibacillus sp. NPDC056232]|uniref:hypothetical protein n=1 Tax=Lysinibacillus sp. NPDC056232 TaxID=3345756 RepID=UPI0035E3260A